MEYLFLSVAAICVSGIYGYSMYLKARPAASPKDIEAMKASLEKHEQRINKLYMGKLGG
jgi:hypothetical protein